MKVLANARLNGSLLGLAMTVAACAAEPVAYVLHDKQEVPQQESPLPDHLQRLRDLQRLQGAIWLDTGDEYSLDTDPPLTDSIRCKCPQADPFCGTDIDPNLIHEGAQSTSDSLCVVNKLLEVVSLRTHHVSLVLEIPDEDLAPNAVRTLLIPPQSAETNIELAKLARRYALGVFDTAVGTARKSVYNPPFTSLEGILDDRLTFDDSGIALQASSGGRTYGEFLASAATEAFWQVERAFEIEVDNVLAVADARNKGQVDDQYEGPLLSRAHAARLLMGNINVYNADSLDLVSVPLSLSRSRLDKSPDVRLALSYLRQSGVAPEDVLDGALSLEAFLNGSSATTTPAEDCIFSTERPRCGSARQRLAERWADTSSSLASQLAAGKPVQDATALSLTAFMEARESLADELRVFQRSRKAIFPTAQASTPLVFPSFAATTTLPKLRPGAFYAEKTRHPWGPLELVDWDEVNGFQDIDEDKDLWSFAFSLPSAPVLPFVKDTRSLGAFLERAGRMLEHTMFRMEFKTPGILSDGERAFLNPTSLLLQDVRRRVPVSVYADGVGPTPHINTPSPDFIGGVLLRVAGDVAPYCGTRLVLGEDGLECAVAGNVEGAPCDLVDYVVQEFCEPTDAHEGTHFGQHSYVLAGDTPADYEAWFTQAGMAGPAPHIGAWNLELPPGSDTQLGAPTKAMRAYLVKPKAPELDSPGDFESLAGITLGDSDSRWASVSIVAPELDERVRNLLAPDPQQPAQTFKDCAGVSGSQPLALENELTDDGDQVEDSWRYYLDLAKQAATEADFLGERVIELRSTLDDRVVDNDSAEDNVNFTNAVQAQAQRAVEQQEIETVQSICGTNIDADVLLEALGKDSLGNPDLSEVYPSVACTPTGPACAEGRCIAGSCIRDIELVVEARANTPSPDQAEWQRLFECIHPSTTSPLATTGTVPLCVWHQKGNINTICQIVDETAAPDTPLSCPTIAEVNSGGMAHCDGLKLPNGMTSAECTASPTCPYSVELVSERIGVVDNRRSPPPPASKSDVCNMFAQLRETQAVAQSCGSGTDEVAASCRAATMASKEHVLNQIRTSGVFDILAQQVGGRIGFEAKPGGFADITVDGHPRYTSGSIFTGPETQGWPCDPAVRGQCSDGLFCERPDYADGTCDNLATRKALAKRMFGAVSAARFVTVPVVGVNTFAGTFSTGQLSDLGPARIRVHRRDVPTPFCSSTGREFSESPDAFEPDDITKSNTVPTALGEFVEIRECAVVRSDTGFLYNDSRQYYAPIGDPFGINTFFSSHESIGPPAGHTSDFIGLSFDSDFHLGQLASLGSNSGIASGTTLAEYLVGDRTLRSVYENEDDHCRCWGARPGHFGFISGLPSDVCLAECEEPTDLRFSALADGAQLLCDVATKDFSDCGTPPIIQSRLDLPAAAAFIRCRASLLTDGLGSQVLVGFPERAKSALQEGSSQGAGGTVGGTYGNIVSQIRERLVALADLPRQSGTEVSLLGNDIQALKLSFEQQDVLEDLAGVREDIAINQWSSSLAREAAACSAAQSPGYSLSVSAGVSAGGLNASVSAGVSWNPGAARATCQNSSTQSSLATDLLASQGKIEQLNGQLYRIGAEMAVTDFVETLIQRLDNLARLGNHGEQLGEEVVGLLILLETERERALRALNRAVEVKAPQLKQHLKDNRLSRAWLNTELVRYEQAFATAKKLAVLARRAVEGRLGMSLDQMHEDLPLVDAPATWANSVCERQGIDPDRIQQKFAGTSDTPDEDETSVSFAEEYIGDYVSRLENLVESYRLAFNFHEGQDTAVVSMRDDLKGTRAVCPVELRNRLYWSSDMTVASLPETPGWDARSCLVAEPAQEQDAGVSLAAPNCLSVRSAEDADISDLVPHDPRTGVPRVFDIQRGPPCNRADVASCDAAWDEFCGTGECGLTENADLAQVISLSGGRYRLSFFQHYPLDSELNEVRVSEGAVKVTNAVGSTIFDPYVDGLEVAQGLDWPGWYKYTGIFELEGPTEVVVKIGAGELAHPAQTQRVGAFMLVPVETLTTEDSDPVYQGTSGTLTADLAACEDTDGATFRATAWTRRCESLCRNGFSIDCNGGVGSEECFWETTFELNQLLIERGLQLQQSGFATGNFNYRIERAGINLVGTELVTCADSATPSTCFANASIPFSIEHTGPYFVRNHTGSDYSVSLFRGHIEHARALAAERYITNPISSSDRDLLEGYMRTEFQGRPLDGSFIVRLWETNSFDFSKIQDVQVILDYRYWTRFD